jgi:hypothetical protein
MTSTPRPDELPDETPGGSTITDPKVFGDPDGVDEEAEPEADFLPPAADRRRPATT